MPTTNRLESEAEKNRRITSHMQEIDRAVTELDSNEPEFPIGVSFVPVTQVSTEMKIGVDLERKLIALLDDYTGGMRHTLEPALTQAFRQAFYEGAKTGAKLVWDDPTVERALQVIDGAKKMMGEMELAD